MTYFKIVNFDKFQHYSTRNPPWIKVYNTLLSNYEFGLLPDETKAHLILIWLLASRNHNAIPYDEGWIRSRIQAKKKINLKLLEKHGFIECYQDASIMLDVEEKRREEKKREERENKNSYGQFKNVLLSEKEFENLKALYGGPAVYRMIEELDGAIASKGLKYKSHYATIINWIKRNDENKREQWGVVK